MELIKDFEVQNPTKKIQLDGTGLPSASLAITADPERFERLLMNLLGNAGHYAKERVVVKHSITKDHFVQISIIDDGHGIAPEDLGKLFKKFSQLNRERGGDGYKGTGLGLAICKEIIEQHGGRIWAESVPDQGATFHFTVPIYEGHL